MRKHPRSWKFCTLIHIWRWALRLMGLHLKYIYLKLFFFFNDWARVDQLI